MAIVLQHRQEERAIRERQLRSGATQLTHIRPGRKRASEVGSLVRLRNGYRRNSYFGPHCVVISSRLISDISELSSEERKYLAPEFASIERMRNRDWVRAPIIEVLVIRTLEEDKL
jgi:hypothetical protein